MTATGATNLKDLARGYLAGGCSILPTGRDKRPFGPALPRDPKTGKSTWKPFQKAFADGATVERWTSRRGVAGIALICGAVSGGLLIIDFDEPGFYERWLELVGDDADRLPAQRTGGGGFQIAVRCDAPGPNVELAHVPDATNQSGRRVAIETRGEGGYAVAPGSMHPSGHRYEAIAGDWFDIPTRAQTAVDFMLECARKLDQAPLTTQQLMQAARAAQPRGRAAHNGQASVIDQWNARHPIGETLLAYGYTPFGPDRLTRPGEGASPGGVVILDGKSFHHSTNDALHDSHTHDSFDLFVTYQHNGDFCAAVKAAAQELGIKNTARSPRRIPPPAKPEEADERSPMLESVCLADVETKPVKWFWCGRFPAGMFSLLCGEPEAGKTWLWVDMAARTTTGTPFPDQPSEPRKPGNVIILADEDPLAEVIVPRLLAHGADLRRIHAIKSVREVDQSGQRVFDIKRDLWLLTQKLTEIGGAELVVFDPAEGYLPASADNDKSHPVRLALNGLPGFCEQHALTVLGVKHLNKRDAGSAGERIAGSHAWRAIARAIWFICRDPDDEDRRLFLKNKLNIAVAAPNLAFSIEAGQVRWHAGTVDMRLDDVISRRSDDEGGERLKEAMDFLRDRLSVGGEVRSSEIDAEAARVGMSHSTLKRAKSRLGIKARAVYAGRKTVWYVRLPEKASTPLPLVDTHGLDDPHDRGDQVDQLDHGGDE